MASDARSRPRSNSTSRVSIRAAIARATRHTFWRTGLRILRPFCFPPRPGNPRPCHRQLARPLPGCPRPERRRRPAERGDRGGDRGIGRVSEVTSAQGAHGFTRAAHPSPGPAHMTCREAIEKLAEYLDAELTPEGLRAIDAHLEVCAPC